MAIATATLAIHSTCETRFQRVRDALQNTLRRLLVHRGLVDLDSPIAKY